MANQHLNETPSASNVSGESSDSMVEINIKTLESQIYSFQVDKNVSKAFLVLVSVSCHITMVSNIMVPLSFEIY